MRLDRQPWRAARFATERKVVFGKETLHLYCPAASGLPVEHLSTLSLLPIHDWNSELLRKEEDWGASTDHLSACVFAIDPFRRLNDLLLELRSGRVKWVTNFPTVQTIDGEMNVALGELGFGLQRELNFIEDAVALGLSAAAVATNTDIARMMIERGATTIVALDRSQIDVKQLPPQVLVLPLEP